MSNIIGQIKQAKVSVFYILEKRLLVVASKDRPVTIQEVKGKDRLFIGGSNTLRLERLGSHIAYSACDDVDFEFHGDWKGLSFRSQFLAADMIFAEREELLIAVIRDLQLAEKLLRH